MSQRSDLLILAGRILLSIMFIISGAQKLVDPAGTAAMIAGAGLPSPQLLTYAAGIFELATGLAVLVGFQTRIAALLLAVFCLFTAFVFHNGPINVPGFSPEANGLLTVFNGLIFWKNVTLAGGYLVLAAAGAGAYSVDARKTAS